MGNQLVDQASEPARVDRGGIELPSGIRPEQQTNQHHGEISVLGVTILTIGKSVQHGRQLRHDLGVQCRQAPAKLRPPERRDADLGE